MALVTSDNNKGDTFFNFSEEPEWEGAIRSVAVLGATTWASMPVTLILAWIDFSRTFYVFVVVKMCITVVLQFAIRRQIYDIVRERRPGSPELEAISQGICKAPPPLADLGSMIAFSCEALREAVLMVLWVIEAVDPDTDAMTPGSAQQTLDKAARLRFDSWWENVPGIGPVIAFLGLPKVLATGLVAVTIWQLKIFRAKYSDTISSRQRSDRTVFYGQLTQLADCSSLLIVASYIRNAWLAIDEDARQFGGMRSTSYRARVPEWLFQTWFSVSLLALTVDKGAITCVPVMFSITCSCVASTKAFCELANVVVQWGQWYSNKHPGPWYKSTYVHTIFLMIVHFLGAMCIGSRLFGVWLCESHELQLHSLRCIPRNGSASS